MNKREKINARFRSVGGKGEPPASHGRTAPEPPVAPELQAKVLQLGGKDHVLRPLGLRDLTRLRQFFRSHTPETIRLRYGYAVAQMSRERARELVGVDQDRDLALAVIEVDGGRETIHAVGRYCLDPDGRGAEVAFVVRESKRRLGMASALFHVLQDAARRRGLEFLWGRVNRDNEPMQALFVREHAVPFARKDSEIGSIDMRLDLAPFKAGKHGRQSR